MKGVSHNSNAIINSNYDKRLNKRLKFNYIISISVKEVLHLIIRVNN